MVSSMNPFDHYVKELLWHKEKWEINLQKAAGVANGLEDFDTLRSNIQRMRDALENCDGFIQESESLWDQSTTVRKSSLKSPLESAKTSTFLASNSSSERSSNGSPFQFSSDMVASSCFSSEDYFDPVTSLTDILSENSEENNHQIFSDSNFLPDATFLSDTSYTSLNGMTQPPSSYWPSSFSSPFGSGGMSGVTDVFSVFTESPKLSFAKVAQALPRKNSSDVTSLSGDVTSAGGGVVSAGGGGTSAGGGVVSVVKVGAVRITETPVVVNQQKSHLAKIIYVFPLSHRMDENLLETYFRQFGRVSKVKVFRYPNGASKTAGIVDFEEGTAAAAALKKKFHIIDGCQIESKPFEPKSHDPGHVSVSRVITRSSHFVNNTEFQVFIGGIPSNATDDDIEKAIIVFGKVKRIQVNPNGTFAFVSFFTEADAQKIVGIHSMNIAGKLVEVKRNQPQPQRPRANTNDSSSSASTTPTTLRTLKNNSSMGRS